MWVRNGDDVQWARPLRHFGAQSFSLHVDKENYLPLKALAALTSEELQDLKEMFTFHRDDASATVVLVPKQRSDP